MSQITLPENYPISKQHISKLRNLQPASKTLYKEKYLNTYLKEVHETLKEKISVDLKVTAQKFNLDLISQEEYLKYKDDLLSSVMNDDIVDGLYDALIEMFSSIDAFSLLQTSTLESAHEPITIENLADFIGEQPEKTTISLTQVYDDAFQNCKSKYEKEVGTNVQEILAETKQLIFVTIFPERPIPSNLMLDADEDDLEIDGGKVDLTCPISRAIFKNPVKNKNCSHTYDLDALRVYLRSSNSCPECRASLSSSSYTPDLMMQARVEAFNRDQLLAQMVQDKMEDETDKL